MTCKIGLLLVIICISIQYYSSQEIATKSRHEHNIIPDTLKPNVMKKLSRISTIRRLFDLKRLRTKRSTIFPTGVKVCPQESIKQIIASHLAYYRLRVCQEAVWEAFRIFMDRIPQTSEYQKWVDACQEDSFCISEIGKNFSSSQEHLDIIQQRVKEKRITEKTNEISSEGTVSPVIIEEPSVSTTGFPYSASASLVTSNDTLFNEIINDTKPLKKDTEVTNLVPEQPKQQTVEFTVTLNNQQFTAELSDPNSPQYQELAASFQHQMEKVFEKLPGFKEIQVIRFRKKKDTDGSDSIVVRYAVVFEKGSNEPKNKIDDTSTITSNKVENGNNEEAIEMSYTVTELREMVAMALRDDRSLPLDLNTLLFSDDPDVPVDPVESDNHPLDTTSTSKMKTDLVSVLTSEVPLYNPTVEREQQTVAYEAPSIGLVNKMAAAVPTASITVLKTNTLFPEEYGTSPLSFHKIDVDLQTPSLEEIMRDFDNKVNGGFTVPLDTLYSKSNVVSPNEKELTLDNTLTEGLADVSFDAWDEFIPSSTGVETIVDNNLTGASTDSTSGIWDEFMPSSTQIVIPYLTAETTNGYTMDNIIVTMPSVVETSGHGDWHVDYPSTDKTHVSSHSTEFLTSENIHDLFEIDEISTTAPISISTVKRLPDFTDSSLLLSSITKEVESNILAVTPSAYPFSYEDSSTKGIVKPADTIEEAVGTLEELSSDVTQLLEETPPVVLNIVEGTTVEAVTETSVIAVGILEGSTQDEEETIGKTTPLQVDMDEAPTVNMIKDTVSKVEETTQKSILIDEISPETFNILEETTHTTTLTQIFLSTEQLSVSESIQKYDNNNIYNTLGDVATSASVIESTENLAASQSHMDKSDGEMGNSEVQSVTKSPKSTSSPDTLSNNTAAFSSLENSTSNTEPSADKGKELVVFFSLRVTNMPFSDDLFNKSSPEYKALEQQFLHLLLPYLQSNLTGFKHLEILNFRKGSVIVNSKLKFAKSLPYNVTEAVHCVLEDFCFAAAQLLNLEIDSYSLDIEPADQANPCKFMACDEFSECLVNSWTKEASCVCKPGYTSTDGLPCQSVCDLQPSYCAEGQKCEILAGKGAVCSCFKGKSWFHSGTQCSKSAAENISIIMVAVSAASLFLVFILLKLIGRMYGGHNHKTQSQVNVKCYSLHCSGKIIPDESLKSSNSPICPTSSCISPSRDTDHRREHTPQHTQLSVQRLPFPIIQENLEHRQ